MHKNKILIVDDNEDDRYIYKRYLRECYEIYEAESYMQGEKILTTQQILCVLLDYSLPGKNGLQILKEWKPLDATRAFVMLTGQGNENIAVESIKSGAQDYIVKDRLSKDVLQKVIANAIEKVDLQQQLLEMQQAALHRERIAALGEMSCGLAHDFNNALSPIQGFVDLLIDIHPEYLYDVAKVKHYLKLIKKSADDASEIVRRMHKFYKPKLEDHKPLQLASIIKDTQILTEPRWKEQAQAANKNIRFICEMEDVCILGNESEIREVLVNLVFNAVDAIEKEGEITLSCHKGGDDLVVLQVKDSGVGMPPEVVERCFEPFYSTKEGRSSGLGLSMVYGIVERHKGEITVDSIMGQGTVFTITFPLTQPVKKVQKQQKSKVETSKFLQILVVDDDDINQLVLEEVLGTSGHIVITAASAQEALQKFSKSIDLVITDLSMPDMKGDALAKKIKEIDPHVNIILLTGYGNIIKEMGGVTNTFAKVMTKPVNARELLEFIADL